MSRRLSALSGHASGLIRLAFLALALLVPDAGRCAAAESIATDGATAICVAPTGDDAGSGSADQPVRTLARALALVPIGGRVSMARGIYREGGLTLARGGTAERPLVIEGAGIGESVITGSVPVTGWRNAGGAVWSVTPWDTNCQQVFADGEPLVQIGTRSPWHVKVVWAGKVSLPPVGSDVDDLVPGSFHHDGDTRTLSCRLADGSDPNAHQLEASSQDCLLSGGSAEHVIVRGVTFRHSNGTATGDRSFLVRTGPSHWTIEDCEFAAGDFTGLGITGDHHIVRGCRIIGNGDTGIDLNGSDAAHGYRWYADRAPMEVLIERCLIAGNNARGFFSDWHAGGMKCVPACRNVTVRGCEVRDNRGAGIWFDHCLGGILIEDNLVVGNRTGIFYEISKPAVGDGYGALIRNNRIVASAQQGVYISASEGARVEGNTFHGNRVNLAIHGMPRSGHVLSGNRARDNIFAAAGLADVILFQGKDASDNQIDGDFYAAKQPRIGLVTGSGYDITHRDLGRLAGDSGCERDGRCGDPGWRGADTLDFALPASSQASGKGWRPDPGR